MVTYYLIGSWMGSFKTKSTTETVEEFLSWANKYGFTPNDKRIWSKDNGRVVFESMDDVSLIKLNNPKIGI